MSEETIKKEAVLRTIGLTEEQENITPELRYSKPSNVIRFTASAIDVVIAAFLAFLFVFVFFTPVNNSPRLTELALDYNTYHTSSQLAYHKRSAVSKEEFDASDENKGFAIVNIYPEYFFGNITKPYDDPERIADGHEYWSVRPQNANAQYSDYRVIQSLAYYYCSYLPNQNLRENDVVDGVMFGEKYIGSPDANKGAYRPDGSKILDGLGNEILAKDYYTVQWFNENVLELTKKDRIEQIINEGSTYDENDYDSMLFSYQRDSEGNIVYDKVGVPKEKYKKMNVLDPSEVEDSEYGQFAYSSTYFTPSGEKTLYDFFEVKYANALKHFESGPTVFPIRSEIDKLTHFFVWGMVSAALLILNVIIPMAIPGGKTLGRLFMGIVIVDRRTGFRAKWWQNLLRTSLTLLIIIMGFAIPYDYVLVPIIVGAGILLIDIILVVINRDKKNSLPDLLSVTTQGYNKTTPVLKNKEEEIEMFLKINTEKASIQYHEVGKKK